MRLTLILILNLLLFTTGIYSQKESYSWYFGSNAGLTFDTPDGEPVALENSQINTLEGVSSISDSTGKLMFYTDGVRVWNSLHIVMNPDTAMHGHFSSTQSALIVKKPGVNSIYYIFTVDAGQYFDIIDPNQPDSKGLCYTVIDAELNNGYGEIVEINKLIKKPAVEKLTATVHFNNQDLWIVSHEWNSNKFISVLLTDQGIEDVITSSVGLNYDGPPIRSIGQLKFSPCGTKLAAAINEYDNIELFSFDNSTGKIFNPISILTFGRYSNYGVEFSPNGNKLYVSDFTKRSIYQYDVSELIADKINLSGHRIYGDKNRGVPGALQIGPNGKIYVAMLNSIYLDVIENPNLTGDECNYRTDAVRLASEKSSAKSLYGLPNMSQGYFFMTSNLRDTVVCAGDYLIIDPVTNVLFSEMTFIWKGPNGYSSNEYFLKINNFSETDVGKYYFQAFFREYIISDSISISYSQIPIAKIIGDSVICSDAPIILSSQFEAHEYFWSTGDSTQSIEVSKPGIYVLTLLNNGHCSDSDTLTVRAEIAKFEYLNPEVANFGEICLGERFDVRLKVKNVTGIDVLIKDVKLIRSSEEIFLNKFKNVLVKKDEIFDIIATVKSDLIGIVDDSLTFIISDFCKIEEYLPISGKIIAPNTLMIPEVESAPGDEICIPVYAKLDCNDAKDFESDVEFQVSFNSDYFYPESISNGEILLNEVVGGKRFLCVKVENFTLSGTGNVLTQICGKVLVGTDVNEPLMIDKAVWHSDLISSSFVYGNLKISACALEIRPINYFKPANLTVKSLFGERQLKFLLEGMSEGDYELTIFNASGIEIENYKYQNLKKGIFLHEFELNTSSLPTGIYFATLKSPWNFKSEKFIIIK
ncbi:MAG: hypothetical protein KGZ71_10900 [Desulfobulbaceae bacterium]|nr:hypothetical protein [Desulfobulbaceae bacterium]